MTNDVEKRWRNPQMLRAAVKYVIAVVAVAGLCFAFYAISADHSLVAAVLVPLVFFAGGLGAFIQRCFWAVACFNKGCRRITADRYCAFAWPPPEWSTNISRSWRLRIFPVGLRGSSSMNSTSRGTLYRARCSLT